MQTELQQVKTYALMNTEERASVDAAHRRWLTECLSPEEAAAKSRTDDLDNIHDELQQQLAELTELNSEDVPKLREAVWSQIHANRAEWAKAAVAHFDALLKRMTETPSDQRQK